MKRYKVIDPNGVHNGSEVIPEGELLPAGATGSQVTAWLRFNQIEAVNADEGEEGDDDKKELKTIADYTEALKELDVQIPNGSKLADLAALYEKAVNADEGEE